MKELCEQHGYRVADLIATIKEGHHRPGVSVTGSLTVRIGQDSSERTAEQAIGTPEIGEISSADDATAERSEGAKNLLGDTISLVDECFELIASSRLAAANVVSTISAAYRLQADFLRTLHELDAIDRTALSCYADQLKCDFNAAKLRLAQRWLEHGRDEVDIGKVTKKLYRGVLGSSDVATAIAEIVDSARDSRRLGRHSQTGDPVFVKVGPNGRVFIQLGRRSDPRPKRALRIELPDRVEYGPSDPERAIYRMPRSVESVVTLNGPSEPGSVYRSSSMRADPRDIALDQALKLIDDKLVSQQPWGIDPKSGRPIFLKFGPYGPYLQLGRSIPAGGSGSIVRIGVPSRLDPNSLTLQEASQLVNRRMEQDRPLGRDPESGQHVYVKDGNFGPFVQLGERRRGGPRVKIVDLPEGLEPDDVGLQQALELLGRFALRELGPHPETGAVVTVQTEGRFGPFVSHRREHVTVPEEFDPMEVTLDHALRLLDAKRDLAHWLGDMSAAFQSAVFPPDLVRKWLDQLKGVDTGVELGKLLRQKQVEHCSSMPGIEKTRLLHRIDGIRAQQLRTAEEIHRRGEIGDEGLLVATHYCQARFDEARQEILADATSETMA
ncbi:MAG: hypothetical protein OXR82_08835 [Gammaproteobacteria bacterium]|nr:hypothetical protein [Gammaproteobacteria bacterium]MDE0258472.1 hypothetical protein [Gammaproteobacteria bacterium]